MSSFLLHYLAVARASGQDAGDFLQAQFTADLTLLDDGDACFTAYCKPSGNVLAVVMVLKQEQEFILVAASELMGPLLAELSRFVLRARVTLEPTELSVFGHLQNDDEEKSFSQFTPRATKLSYGIEPAQPLDSSVDVSRWRQNELRSDLVWLTPETSNQFLPQMIGLEALDGLSFRTGCFPGQEVIARVRYLGKIKRRPVVVEEDGQI